MKRLEQRMEARDVMTMLETAEFIGISENTLRAWCRSGVIRFIKRGNRVFFLRHLLLADLERMAKGAD